MKHPILKSGLFRWSNNSDNIVTKKGELELIKWLKKSLGYLNTPYSDPCCDTDPDAPSPMRYNNDDNLVERYDVTSKTWQTLPALCFYWHVSNTSGSAKTINYSDCSGNSQSVSVNNNATTNISGTSISAPVTGVTITFLGLD